MPPTAVSVPINVVDVETEGDLAIRQLPTAGLGDHTYLLRSGKETAVVDPQCDLDRLEGALQALGGRLVAVLETHVHNDYVSGGRVLAQRHHAAYCVPSGAGSRVEHTPMGDGDEVRVGHLRLRALPTPGHTPHHTSYAVVDPAGVVAVFSGGCLLVGACGRTDLVSPDLTEELTRAQYRSAHRIGALGDSTAVAPTHGAGSFCTASAAAADTWTTVAREHTRNPAFLAGSEDDFVRGQLSGLLAYPAYYAHMAELNRDGGAAWEPGAVLPTLDPGDLEGLMTAGVTVIDGRSRHAFAAGHIPGTVNVELDPSFATYVGWLFPFGSRLAFVLGPDQDPLEAVRQCARVGIGTVEGVLAGGVEAWAASGRPVANYPVTDVAGMEAARRNGGARLLDVRQQAEWDEGRAPGAVHIHVPDLPGRVGELQDSSEPVYVYCRTGHRAAMGASLLDAAGLPAVLVDGGFPDWVEHGFPVEGG